VHEPNHVFVDASGNLYFTDANNLRIRKVDAATGNINTVAGNGTQILSGDGIPATSSGFNFIGGMTLDTASNIYISDFAYYRIRKVDSLLQNQPPVANAGPDQNVICTPSAGADVALDGSNSSDPDIAPLSYSWSEGGVEIATGVGPMITLVPGTHNIDLVVNDGTEDSASDQVVITVVEDVTAPEVLAALNSVEKPESSKYYQVVAQATDLCDVSPVVTALINQPLTAADVIDKIKYKASNKENKIEIKMGKKIEVTLRGPDEAVLQGLLNDAIAQGGFSVADSQVLKLKSKGQGKSSKAKDPRDGHYKYQFDLDLALEEVDGISVRMVVSAVDAAGNAAEPVEVALPASGGPAAKLVAEQQSLPEIFQLGNYPNPFNPNTTIAYQLPNAGEVSLVIYNTMGQQVRNLVQGYRSAGVYQVEWNGRDDDGRAVSSGLYLHRFVSAGWVETQRMTLLK
jgi:hypothetical protein